ncbi:unnamed protein product, partial [marine sediment metagenome]
MGGDRSEGFAHISCPIDEILDTLTEEIEQRIEGRSGFVGAVREDERELSKALDLISEHEDAHAV